MFLFVIEFRVTGFGGLCFVVISDFFRVSYFYEFKFSECILYVVRIELGEVSRGVKKERLIVKERLLICRILSMITGNVKVVLRS